MNSSHSLTHDQQQEQEQEPYRDDPSESALDHGASTRLSLPPQNQAEPPLPSEPQKYCGEPSHTRSRPQRYHDNPATIYPPPHPAPSTAHCNSSTITPSLPSDAPPSYDAALAAAYNDTFISRIHPSSQSYYPPGHPTRAEDEDEYEYSELMDHTSFKVERWVARIIVLTILCVAGLMALHLAQNGML